MKKKINHLNYNIPGELFAATLLCFVLNVCNAGTPLFGHSNVKYNFCNAPENIMDVPLSMVVYNECCDEEVYLTGTGHIVINDNVKHVIVSDITGIGLSTGYAYNSLGSQCLNNVLYWSPVEGTFTLRINMRNEDGCSFKVSVTLHLTINANDEVAVSFENIATQCH